MNPDVRSDEWDDRLRQGDPGAAEQLFAQYAQRLVRVAEQYLSRRLAVRVDGDDVVQSVFRTFFRRAAAGEFRIESSEKMWSLLVRITVLKARATGRFHSAGKRAGNAELGGSPDEVLANAVCGQPGPSEAAALVDQIDALLRGLPDVFARVLELRLAGVPVTDVARELGLSRQAIYRMLALLQQRLEAVDSCP